MNYLLDTNVCIAFLNGEDEGVKARLLALSPRDCFLCSIVKGELIFGARKSKQVEKNLKKLGDFFQPFESAPFDDLAAEYYGAIRNQLEREGQIIGANDLLIAAIAQSGNFVLVTKNQSEFLRVAGLRTEAW